jgi:hypothetical protein
LKSSHQSLSIPSLERPLNTKFPATISSLPSKCLIIPLSLPTFNLAIQAM